MNQPPKDDGFQPIEPANLIVLGDKKKQSKAFGGLLIDIVQDEQYKAKQRYLCVGRDGKEYEIAGNASLARRIKRTHIGCLVKLVFKGWERGPNGNYKVLEVLAQPRSRTTDEQKAMFPRWAEFEKQDATDPEAGLEAAPADEEENGEEQTAAEVKDVLDF